jgi:hypothetical protein
MRSTGSIQSVAAIRDSSVNAVVNEAIEFWLADETQHKTIDTDSMILKNNRNKSDFGR